MKITKNFTLKELYASGTARVLGIDNRPSGAVIVNLIKLCRNVLQPLRDAKGCIIINSGYRCPALNKAVGGATMSQHTTGEAVDISLIGGMDYGWDLFEYIQTHLPFDQLIMEHNAKGVYWIHVSYREGNNRKQVIRNLLKK